MKIRNKVGLFILIALVTLLTGCNKNSEKELNIISDTSRTYSEKESNIIDDTTRTYPYKELNVIGDNYRTYYEVFLYSFYDSDGDGIGDIQGLISKLDYINDGDSKTDSDLGFNGIWLMPIMESTTYHKYDVVDYYTIDPEYGTMEDFKELIEACDKRGIKVILDLVLNHTSDESEWFQSAVKSLSIEPCGETTCTVPELCREHNPYCSYYNFVEGKPKTGNYYATGAGDWYYEGKFWDKMPDLNLENQNLRRDLEQVMKYWLHLGVGGFRLDAAKEFDSGNNTNNIEILKWVREYVKGVSEDNYLVAEIWDSFLVYAKYYESGIDSIFDFTFGDSDGKIVKTLNLAGRDNSGRSFAEAMVLAQDTFSKYNPNFIDAPFFTNHDTGRAAGFLKHNETNIKMAAAMNLFMSGSAFVYYGEELGMSGSGIDENKRAPMYWSVENVVGMTKGPVAMQSVIHRFPSLEEQSKDENSIYCFYKDAIRLRNVYPEIARGKVSVIEDVEHEEICAIKKEYKDHSIIMLYNFSAEEIKVSLDSSKWDYTELGGSLIAAEGKVSLEGDTVTLPGYSIAVLD